ncbi:MAG: hypothetical protein RSP_13530 [Rhodanobacter sp.]
MENVGGQSGAHGGGGEGGQEWPEVMPATRASCRLSPVTPQPNPASSPARRNPRNRRLCSLPTIRQRGHHRDQEFLLRGAAGGRLAGGAGLRIGPAFQQRPIPQPAAAAGNLRLCRAGDGGERRVFPPAPRAADRGARDPGHAGQPPAPADRAAVRGRRGVRHAGRDRPRTALYRGHRKRPRQPAGAGKSAPSESLWPRHARLAQPLQLGRQPAQPDLRHGDAGRRHRQRHPAVRTGKRRLGRLVPRGRRHQPGQRRGDHPRPRAPRGRAPPPRTAGRRADRHRQGAGAGQAQPAARAGGAAFPLQHAGQRAVPHAQRACSGRPHARPPYPVPAPFAAQRGGNAVDAGRGAGARACLPRDPQDPHGLPAGAEDRRAGCAAHRHAAADDAADAGGERDQARPGTQARRRQRVDPGPPRRRQRDGDRGRRRPGLRHGQRRHRHRPQERARALAAGVRPACLAGGGGQRAGRRGRHDHRAGRVDATGRADCTTAAGSQS